MKFNEHYRLNGKHAFLSPSSHAWTNYDAEKLDAVYLKHLNTVRGTRLHEFAKECIELKIKLPRSKKTLNAYVNDAIGYRMTPEQVLFYSENAFGTADAISFRDGLLRIHDLKTGVTKTSMRQLEVYVALFCLEYSINPNDIAIELRIYQNDEFEIYIPQPEDILYIIKTIEDFDVRIEKMKEDLE